MRGLSLSKVDQVLVLADFPVLLERSCYGVVDHISDLVVFAFVLNYLELQAAFLFLLLPLFLDSDAFALGPHFDEVVNTLPNKATVVGLVH